MDKKEYNPFGNMPAKGSVAEDMMDHADYDHYNGDIYGQDFAMASFVPQRDPRPKPRTYNEIVRGKK